MKVACLVVDFSDSLTYSFLQIQVSALRGFRSRVVNYRQPGSFQRTIIAISAITIMRLPYSCLLGASSSITTWLWGRRRKVIKCHDTFYVIQWSQETFSLLKKHVLLNGWYHLFFFIEKIIRKVTAKIHDVFRKSWFVACPFVYSPGREKSW